MLLASLIFYAWGEPVYIFLMLLSILFNYFSGLDIARNLTDRRLAKRSLIFNIVVNIAILGFFKYEGFVLDSLNAVLPVHITYHPLALPIGISFYTFQILSYIIDVYRGNVKVQKNILNFALYVTMFPQLIAGPIVQYADVEEQLVNRKSSWNKFGEGGMYFIRGLAKKVLLANTSGMIFTEVTGLGKGNVSVLSAWLGAFAYMFQIYFDFSGYSDMAVGLGKMFGFEFCMNFNYPYIAKSYGVLAQMAYFSEQLVQGLCIHSARGQQSIEEPAYLQSNGCMVSDRIMARSCMEFRGMGIVLRDHTDH